VTENFFRQRRDELGLTQRAIADRLGMTPQAIGLWERSETLPAWNLVDQLAEIYQVTPERLMNEIAEQARAMKQTA
jgi:transcriptional regulator with XRE-family HTH domain